ncbi:c-type cytochrome biogenesis protein CcsB [Filimonas lacunae]|nr:c-type cytochrome biogenesis protein CcsB [Filimonas lacunae]BAV04746.1 cytochrome C-type biogenesis protein [Filimonas lacunae]
MAAATFIENDYGTPVAKELVYNAWWFELVMVILVVNFVGNIARYKLYKRQKWPLLVFHIAFLFIFLGGAITRYISFEGSMHIREGEMENRIISDATFFKVQIASNSNVQNYTDKKTNFIPNNSPAFLSMLKPRFSADYTFQGDKINMRLIDFIPRAQDSLIANSNEPMVLHMVSNENGARRNVYIPSGTSKTIQGVEVGFNKETPDGVAITSENDQMFITSALPARYMVMATRETDTIKALNTKEPLRLRALYNMEMGPLFVIPEYPQKGHIERFEGDPKKDAYAPDLVVMAIKSQNKQDTVAFYGGKGLTGYQAIVPFKDYKISMGYGSRFYYTPFYIHLDKFELDKYPGSNSPSSFASQVVVKDAGEQMPYRIFMNNILHYRGFRFFQSSYDPDEKGTVLSVNHDQTGTMLTYIGYAMLFSGMFFTLFWKGTRFSILKQQLKSIASKKELAILLILLSAVQFASAQDNHNHEKPNNPRPTDSTGESFAKTVSIDKKHATLFGYLPVQNIEGRIEPINTLALEVIRKLYRKDGFYNLDANQFFLSISSRPLDWVYIPFIKVNKRGGNELLQLTKANADGYTSIMNLLQIDTTGEAHFLLEQQYNTSFAKKAADQDNYDKEVIELNDKMQAAQMLLNGSYLRIIPVAGDKNNTWTALNFMEAPKTKEQQLVLAYFSAIQNAQQSNDWSKADEVLQQIEQYQVRIGGNIMPSQAKINWEVRFNNWNMFFKLMIFYAMAGTLLLIISFISLFNKAKAVRYTIDVLISLLMAAAVLQAFGLGVRWYISGHAPWSNGYEAVMFISLIGLTSGLLLYKNSNSFIPAAGALIAVILMGFAHGGAQMNPQITQLVPVLKSYWLMIHVAIITGSYGFFGLSALLGMMVLLLHIANNKQRRPFIDQSLRELTIVNELSMTIGIFMLTIGTFLGGMWANESWGRYWSWDPKETWAFISVIVYAFVLHVRLIPGLGSKFLFNFLALISFSTVIMTYFGVNYYLSGLHSYAKGDPMPIPSWIYITIAIITTVSVTALIRYKQLNKTLQATGAAPLEPLDA